MWPTTEFRAPNLDGGRFERVRLGHADMRAVDLTGARINGAEPRLCAERDLTALENGN